MAESARAQLREFYEHVFPVDLLVQMLDGPGRGYLARREFCFTLLGDVFTRFRSYGTEAALRQALVRDCPEKIDAGAVYDVPPDKKHTVQIIPTERELVFDIDMSDYDAVRSCCKGKKVCPNCWAWMACAGQVLREVLRRDFGYEHLLPVFSGRRGLHVWVLDPSARRLSDDERSAIVGYMTVVTGSAQVSVLPELRAATLHPSMRRVDDLVLAPCFEQLFLSRERTYQRTDALGDVSRTVAENRNCIFVEPAAARTVHGTLLTLEREFFSSGLRGEKVADVLPVVEEGEVLSEEQWATIVRRAAPAVLTALRFALLYPRLDEKVSTRRDHLLKVPFCVHPGTGRLCVPLAWDTLGEFDPLEGPPTLTDLLDTRQMEGRWKLPLLSILAALKANSA